jgi:hypothetical protein
MAEKENIKKIPSNDSPKSYVTEGISLNCTFGDSIVKLETPGRKSARINDKLQANITDFKPMVNIKSFGKCSCRGNPMVSSATAANHGALTPMPCIPNITMPWINGKEDVMVDGAPPLLETSKNMCLWGGTISIGDNNKPKKRPNRGRVCEGTTKVANGGLLCWIGLGALSVAGVAFMVLTAPVSVPSLVVAAAVGTLAAGGAGAAICLTTGASDINEGRQDIKYGMAGSNEESHNPLKETIGSEAYYNAEMIGTGLSLAAMAEVPYLAPFAATAGVGEAGAEIAMNRKLASQQKSPPKQNPVKTSALKLETGEVNAVEETKLAENAATRRRIGGRLTPEQVNNRINLRGATHDELARLKASGIGKKQLGPAVAGVYDAKTGKYYFGINDPKGNLPSKIHPLIEERIKNMPPDIRDGYIKTIRAGSHAEINALNEALLARSDARLDDFMVHVISTKPLGPNIPAAGMPMPRCPHCEYITNGVNYIPEVLKYGGK